MCDYLVLKFSLLPSNGLGARASIYGADRENKESNR